MWKRLILPAPVLGTLLLLASADLQEALPTAEAGVRDGPVPTEDERPLRSVSKGTTCLVCAAAARAGLRLAPLRGVAGARCSLGDYAARATLPRGRVRPDQFTSLRFDLHFDAEEAVPGLETDPYIELRDAVGRLARLPLSTERTTAHVRIPTAVQRKLRGIRSVITWGRPDALDPSAAVRVVLDNPSTAERMDAARLRSVTRHEPTWIRNLLRAQLLINQSYDYEALLLARSVLARMPTELHAAALVNEAYYGMGLVWSEMSLNLARDLVHPTLRSERRPRSPCHLDVATRPGYIRRSRSRQPRGGCGGEWRRPRTPPQGRPPD